MVVILNFFLLILVKSNNFENFVLLAVVVDTTFEYDSVNFFTRYI